MKATGHVLIREATEDTVLTIPKVGEEGSTTVPIPKGTQVRMRAPFSSGPDPFVGKQVTVDMVGVRECSVLTSRRTSRSQKFIGRIQSPLL
jgi:hypothetical protein